MTIFLKLMKISSYKMLYYGRIIISEGIPPIKSNRRKECMICQNWFFNHGLKFRDSVSDMATITVKNVSCLCIIRNISRSEAINLLKISVLENCGYITKYCHSFQSTQGSCFLTFLF